MILQHAPHRVQAPRRRSSLATTRFFRNEMRKALRQLRKSLKRAQRRLALLTPLNHEQKVARVTKLTDLLAKRLSDLTQGAKKVQANPYVRSLKKKTKSLNKRKKKLDRIAKKLA